MIQFLNRSEQNTQQVAQNTTLVFVNQDGKICTKDNQGNITIIGSSTNTGFKTPRMSEREPGKNIYFKNSFTGTEVQHFEKFSKWKGANDKEDKLTRLKTDFLISDLGNLYTAMLRGWMSDSNVSNSVINSVVNYCSSAANYIYLEQGDIPAQDYFVLTDQDTNNRHVHDLCIDMLLNLAVHFDPTIEVINPISKNNLAYFNFDENETVSQIENNNPSEFTTGGQFETTAQKAFLGKIIGTMADILNQLYDCHNFLSIYNTPVDTGSRDTTHIGVVFGSFNV